MFTYGHEASDAPSDHRNTKFLGSRHCKTAETEELQSLEREAAHISGSPM